MLCVNSYKKEFIESCRSRMAAQVATYKGLLASCSHEPCAVAKFEQHFFGNLVLVLECSFMHRTRALEGKDGNPCNEVRMLSNSILQNGGALAADKTIKYDPAKTVLQIPVGCEITMSEGDFDRLSKAFFAEIESRFGEKV